MYGYLKERGFENIQKSDKGVYFAEESSGNTTTIEDGDVVTLDYRLRIMEDSAFQTAEDFTTTIGGTTIEGFEDGLKNFFKEGTKGTIAIPYELAYGVYGSGNIRGFEDLIFDIEVKSITKAN